MDAQTLRDVMAAPNGAPALTLARYEELLPAYRRLMQVAKITNVNRAAMLAAQLGHESVGLKYAEEIASGAAYEGRRDLGNTQPGDGRRFKGHGWIQITGRANHTACSQWAHEQGLIDSPTLFVDHPERLGWDEFVWIGPAWYWTVARPDLNALADRGDLDTVTRRINGGLNGLADRRARWNRALTMGQRLLDSAVSPAPLDPHTVLMTYSRDNVTQLTPWNCGPASVETAIQAATGGWVRETQLAGELKTHQGGTDSIEQFPQVLNRHIPGAQYVHVEMPADPPTTWQKNQLWEHITRSLDAGHPVIANIVAPPSNYPRSVAPSTVHLAYGGGVVYHYVAIIGYAGEGSARRVWWADSGFAPYGAWISFDQTATLIPPKGYAWSAAPPLIQSPTFLETLMTEKVQSYISPGKSFEGHTALSLIDASTWRSEVLTEALLIALGLDTQAIQAAAIEADTTGGDRTAAIRAAINKKGH